MQQDRVHVRLLIIAGVAFLWMGAVAGRLSYLQLFRHSEYLTRAQRQQQRTIEITPKRGAIYDRNNSPLAMSLPVDSAFGVPSEIPDEHLAARLLSGVVNVPQEVLEARFESSKSFAWISRKLPPEKAQAIAALNLKGVYLQKENQRFYPKRDLAAHVLGFVDVDEKGLAGIERELDSQIRGKNEKVIVMADARQRWFDRSEDERESATSVTLTLDEKIQFIAERELASAIAKTHALAGTIIVMNPNNGEILALTNWPKFNPSKAGDAPKESWTNRAVSDVYEPGSIFKLITLSAAFDQGITRPEEVFDCQNGAVTVSGHRIRDHKPFGMLSVAEILAKSSNVGTIEIALRLEGPKFYDYVRAFGFGSMTGVDMPYESRGRLEGLKDMKPLAVASISIGQEIGVTPIQFITAVSAIANGGILYKPHVIAELRRGDRVLPADGPLAPEHPKRVIRPETAATLRRLMEGVILNGTGTPAHLDGWTAAGKTGTAQKIDPETGRYSPTNYIASFTGLAPINNPAVTILISLDSPVGLHEGGEVAAPVFKRVAEQVLPYLDVPQDVPLNPKLIQAAYRKQPSEDTSSLEDSATMDFSGQPDATPAASQKTTVGGGSRPASQPPITVAVEQGGDIAVPDLSGKTMREVTEMCLRLGFEPVLVGSNLATEQSPAAGSKVKHGARITVQFGTPVQKKTPLRTGNRN
ncbi:MAG: penicillin-binding protein [Candidatus Acidiferrum sp.]|jgi:cell division protein FtsI (penicillin-binding protein 3)